MFNALLSHTKCHQYIRHISFVLKKTGRKIRNEIATALSFTSSKYRKVLDKRELDGDRCIASFTAFICVESWRFLSNRSIKPECMSSPIELHRHHVRISHRLARTLLFPLTYILRTTSCRNRWQCWFGLGHYWTINCKSIPSCPLPIFSIVRKLRTLTRPWLHQFEATA